MSLTKNRIRRIEEKLWNVTGENDVTYKLVLLSRDGMHSVIEATKNGKVFEKIDPESSRGKNLIRNDGVKMPELALDV